MKILACLLLFTLSLQAQIPYTNNPEQVYPVLEEFISDNLENKTSVLPHLRKLDSIIVQKIPLKNNKDGTYAIRYGIYHPTGDTGWIEIHPFTLKYPRLFEQVLIHELGHVLGMKHIDTRQMRVDDPRRMEIMAHPRSGLITEENYHQMKEKFYSELHTILMNHINSIPQ